MKISQINIQVFSLCVFQHFPVFSERKEGDFMDSYGFYFDNREMNSTLQVMLYITGVLI